MAYLDKGQQAPAFTLQNQQGQPVSLAELLKSHRVLVYFYPKAMTPGCTVQACGLRDRHAELAGFNVQAVGISPDAPKSLLKFTERDQLNFLLLSDPDHQVADAFGVWGPKKFMGRTFDGIHRISFLIEQDGRISHVFDNFKTSNHHDVVVQHLAGQ